MGKVISAVGDKNYTWLSIAIVLFLIISLSAVCAYSLFLSKDSESGLTRSITNLSIDSNPPGIVMEASLDCASDKRKITTPQVCKGSLEDLATSITAPMSVSVGGQSYEFKKWEGCSEKSSSASICGVRVSPGMKGSILARYEKAPSLTGENVPIIPAKVGGQINPVSCVGGVDSGSTCTYTIDVINIPTSYDIRADQVTPFPLIMEGAPLSIDCAPTGACAEYLFSDQAYHEVSSVTGVRTVSWRVSQAAKIKITAEKNHTYKSNDGKTRTWKFKQLVQSGSTGYDYVSVQYDFVSMK